MFSTHKKLTAGLISLAIGLSAGGYAASAHQSDITSTGEIVIADPVRCELLADSENGRLELESVFHTDMTAQGSYRLQVASSGPSGRSRISQGGYFQANAGAPETLGRVMLGSHGTTYDVQLSVSIDGADYSCSERYVTD